MDLLTHTIAALVGGGAVYLWMRGTPARLDRLLREALRGLKASQAERDRLQSELTRLTDRDELGRYVRKEPK